MPLLGRAALLLSFDIAAEAIDEHDDWHTHEHLPERLSIPGFLRGSRWVALDGGPRYVVLYEVAELATLTSGPYLDRLDRPSAWTSRLVPHYRGMRRGLCAVSSSVGLGVGHLARVLRFEPPREGADALRRRLVDGVLPTLPERPGLGGAHLLEAAAAPPMTREQSIRGADAGVGWAVVVTGYRQEAVAAPSGLDAHALCAAGASAVVDGLYRLDYALTSNEIVDGAHR